MSSQLQLFHGGITEAHVGELLALLRANGWLTRRQLRSLTGWAERTIRAVAEAAGAQVVRGPRGFNLGEQCSLDELKHCGEIAIAQGTKMIHYGHELLKLAHRRVA